MEVGSMADWFSGIVGAIVLAYSIYQSKRSKKIKLKIIYKTQISYPKDWESPGIPVDVKNESPERVAEIDNVALFVQLHCWKKEKAYITSTEPRMYSKDEYGANLVPGEAKTFNMKADASFLYNLRIYRNKYDNDLKNSKFSIVATERSGVSFSEDINFDDQFYINPMKMLFGIDQK